MNPHDLRYKLLLEDFSTHTVLFAGLPHQQLARIVGALIGACMSEVSADREVMNVATIAANPTLWSQGHAAFDSVRERVLDRESADISPNDAAYHMLLVAENVARVIYNATEPADPFDDDSAAWMMVTYVQLARCLESEALIDAALKILTRELAT